MAMDWQCWTEHGEHCDHDFVADTAVFCGTKLRLVGHCRHCEAAASSDHEVEPCGKRNRPCPLCGGRVLPGGTSVLEGEKRFSIGCVCLRCHVHIRYESDPEISASINVISSVPSVHDDPFTIECVLHRLGLPR